MWRWRERAALTLDLLVKGWMPMDTTSGFDGSSGKRAKLISGGATLLLPLPTPPPCSPWPGAAPAHGKKISPFHPAASLPRAVANAVRSVSGMTNADLSALKPHQAKFLQKGDARQ